MDETKDPSGLKRPEGSPPDPLLSWALGALHTSSFLIVLLFLFYQVGSPGDILQVLSSLIGSVVFALLWVSTWFWSRWTLQDKLVLWMADAQGTMRFSPMWRRREGTALVSRAILGGGLNGASNFLVLFMVIFGLLIVSELPSGGLIWDAFLVFVFYLLIGLAIAVTFGALVGLALSLIDSVLIFLTDRLAPVVEQAVDEPSD